MAIGDVHIAGPNGWALCGESGPLRGYTAMSPPCRDCEHLEHQQKQVAAASLPQARPRSFRIINGDNGYGLSRDRDIVSEIFRSRDWTPVDGTDPVIANVHLERISPSMLSFAHHNIVIPNPEWWIHVGNVGVGELNAALVDPSVRVWAKTEDSARIFRGLGARVEHIGFRSCDRNDPTVPRERAFLHVAGVGPNKMTSRLLSLWRPEWPRLTVTRGDYSSHEQGNIRIIGNRLTDGELRTLQNRHLYHIYPSRYEGFGHAQWEGLSCGAIVFVAEGPPFDEHPNAFHALTALVCGQASNGLVSWRDVQTNALVEAIAWARDLSDKDVTAYQENARETWERADKNFLRRIRSAIAVHA